MTALQRIRADLKIKLPPELVDALLLHYVEIKENFYLGKHEPSELNGGKFAEICFRILQHQMLNGAYTPVGQQVSNLSNSLRQFEQVPSASAIDSYRLHIPRTLILMADVRNKRGVAHPNLDINPNEPDSTLLVSSADWVMAELFRVHYGCAPDEAQAIVNSLVQRRLTVVYEIEDSKRVLVPSLSPKDKILLLLFNEHPKKVLEVDLLSWLEVESKDITNFRNRHLKILHKDKLIEYRFKDWCLILPTGIRYVESQYQSWVDEFNKDPKNGS